MSSTIVAQRLYRFAFNGTATAAGIVLGAPSTTGVTNTIPGLTDSFLPVQWEVKNDEVSPSTTILHAKPGPSTDTFAGPSGTVLGNYSRLSPAQAYSYPKRHYMQEVGNEEAVTGVTVAEENLLMLRGDGANCAFSGWVDCWYTAESPV